MASDVESDLLSFLSISSRFDLKLIALDHILGLTGTAEGRTLISQGNGYLPAIVALTSDESINIVKKAYLTLVNLSTVNNIPLRLSELPDSETFILSLFRHVLDRKSIIADVACMLLSNLSRVQIYSRKIVDVIVKQSEEVNLHNIVVAFTQSDYNVSANLHYIGPLLSNITQVKDGRMLVLDRRRCIVQRLFPFVEFSGSLVRRGGVVGALRNCCFEKDAHEWLLGDDVDILPRLLLPLAGAEEFDEEDMNKLPEDLQYLLPGKERESDPDIRQMLVESVHQLCLTLKCRSFIKSKNTYVILRELDRWEQDAVVKASIHRLIQLLISDEPDETMASLDEVAIPSEIEGRLQKAYEEESKELLKNQSST